MRRFNDMKAEFTEQMFHITRNEFILHFTIIAAQNIMKVRTNVLDGGYGYEAGSYDRLCSLRIFQ